uniref:CSON011400 protein n=1 Tax=Culicoides sonorensis TaxID=179676 RepID=A0A336N1J4_CULSO
MENNEEIENPSSLNDSVDDESEKNAQTHNFMESFPHMNLLDNTSRNQTITQLVEHLNRLKAQNETLKQQYETAYLENVSLKQDLKRSQSLFQQVQVVMGECEQGYNSLVDAVEDSKKFESKLTQKTENLEKLLADSCKMKEIDELKEQLIEMEQKCSNLAYDKEQLQSEFDSIVMKIQAVQDTNALLKEELKQKKQELDNAQNQLNDNGVSIATLREKEEQMKQFIVNLRAEINRMRMDANDKEKEYQDAITSLNEMMETKQDEHQHNIERMYEGLKEAQSIVHRTSEEMTHRNEHIEELNIQKGKLRQENDEYRKQNTELLLKLQNIESSLMEAAQLKQEYDTMKIQLNATCNEIDELKSKLFDYHRREFNQQMKIDEKERELQALKLHIAKQEIQKCEPILQNMKEETSAPKEMQEQGDDPSKNFVKEPTSTPNGTINTGEQKEQVVEPPRKFFFKHIQPGKPNPGPSKAVPPKPRKNTKQTRKVQPLQSQQSSESDVFAIKDSDSDSD